VGLVALAAAGFGTLVQAGSAGAGQGAPGVNGADDGGGVAASEAAFTLERTLPAGFVSGAALATAVQQANALPKTGGSWTEVTNRPYVGETAAYSDPFWSNVGAGFRLVGGRTTALATTADGTWFAGTADGGVWRSGDQGAHWTPTFDSMPTLSIGAVAVDPAGGSLWVGTGESNTSQDSYAGNGVYRSTDDGASYARVGDDSSGNNPLVSHTVFDIAFAPGGTAYAATDNGLWRLAAGSNTWSEVLDPAGPTVSPPYQDQVTNVQIVPGSNGAHVIAVNAWRSAAFSTNGFYDSTDGGLHFTQVTPTGDINTGKIGRTTLAYSADGSKLYAIVEDPTTTGLQGFFVATGAPASIAGPWKLIANSAKLAASGSASPTFGAPGEQSWYNQDLAVDPANPNHVYAGLEEVYQTVDGGANWTTASPYWNYNFACDSNPAQDQCPPTTHPDQHTMMITGGSIVIGNDGGVYSRPLSDANGDDGNWTDLNATLRSWQYYDARAGRLGGHGTGVWGGLQDNGTSLIAPGLTQMVEPASGDGFDVIVDPSNARNMVGEYVDGTTYESTDGGVSFKAGNTSPGCFSQQSIYGITPRTDCDPAMRFVTPLVQDQQNTHVWFIGGQDVWMSTAGWSTTCTDSACSWQNVFDTGAGHAVTALSSANGGEIAYAAWVGGGGNPGPAFSVGLATNYGGTWHQINMAGLPNRYIDGVTVDPANPAHAYAIFNGYSRRWIPAGGVGHVFETTNGGASWTDVSGNLPDIPSDALVIDHGQLALATDAGVFTAGIGQGSATSWSKLGTGLPNAAINDLTIGPGDTLYAATHGRGIWSIRF